ncbi:hypothetical protein SAMN05444370_1557 [Rubrimonas cliftonensis]|uniref:Uncharacterized protein n=1 Tax=Rubrimonas cliftonensis TaxID=89524 RepID=A0A1H4GE84_9RHOB|nr:hypothetical protein SAMN05444370_1557 [Rubrimonas cliftonensis]
MSWLRYTLGTIAVLAVILYFALPPTLRAMGFHPPTSTAKRVSD